MGAVRAGSTWQVCPNQTVCDQLIREVAPLDMEMYALAQRRLQEAVDAIGPSFRADLEQLRHEKRHSSLLPKCVWRPMMPLARFSPQMDKHGRQAVFAMMPRFDNDTLQCPRGDRQVMGLVWSEHARGGRAKSLYHQLVNVSVARQRNLDRYVRFTPREAGDFMANSPPGVKRIVHR